MKGSDEPPCDRPFYPWRTAKSDAARALVADVGKAVDDYECRNGTRQRKRKPADEASFRRTIEAVICDAVHHHFLGVSARISVTRNKAKLALGSIYRSPALGKALPRVLDYLSDLQFVHQVHGFGRTGPRQWKDARQTTFEAGPTLVNLVHHYAIGLEDLGRDEAEPLILLKGHRPPRSAQQPKPKPPLIEYDPKCPVVRQLHAVMVVINRWSAEADLQLVESFPGELQHIDPSERRLQRHFTRGSFSSSGRMFGGWWLNARRSVRLTRLRINGQSVVSFDFRGMFIALLYGKAKVQVPRNHFDPYLIPGLEAYRRGIKRVMTASLFRATPMTKTPRGVRQYLPSLMKIEDVLSRIKDHHAPIAGFLDTEIGHELMHQESNIMVMILLQLRALGIHALPTHDAVTCARSDAKVVKQVMQQVAWEAAGVVIDVHEEESSDEAAENDDDDDDDDEWMKELMD